MDFEPALFLAVQNEEVGEYAVNGFSCSLGVIVIAVWDGFRSNSLLYSRLYQRLRRGY